MDAKIRKTEINLITLGTGVIFFGVWTLVKSLVSFFLVVAGIIVFFRSILVVLEIIAAIFDHGDSINLLISAFIDITTIVFLVELMVYSIRLKKIRKAEPAKEAD